MLKVHVCTIILSDLINKDVYTGNYLANFLVSMYALGLYILVLVKF
jgi:hypothetical protein